MNTTAMRFYGVKGFPEEADAPTAVLQVRARSPERAIELAAARPIVAGMRLEAVEVGGALPVEGVIYEGPWPWPGQTK